MSVEKYLQEHLFCRAPANCFFCYYKGSTVNICYFTFQIIKGVLFDQLQKTQQIVLRVAIVDGRMDRRVLRVSKQIRRMDRRVLQVTRQILVAR